MRGSAAPLRAFRVAPSKLLGGFIVDSMGDFEDFLQVHGSADPRAALSNLLGGFEGDFEEIRLSA